MAYWACIKQESLEKWKKKTVKKKKYEVKACVLFVLIMYESWVVWKCAIYNFLVVLRPF